MKQIPKVAIVYDRVNKFGGAERVLGALHTIFPTSVLFTSVYDPEGTPWVGSWEVRTSFLQHVPFAKKHHEWFAICMPLAFETLDVSGFDIVISVTSEFAKNVLTSPSQVHICYCLTPTRYLWSHTREYGEGTFSLFKATVFSLLRMVDTLASQRPDVFFAISEHVKKRIETYYRRSVSKVILPTVVTMKPTNIISKRDYYIVVARLVPYKKVDLAIQACKKMKRHLRIVGRGSDEQRLRESAGDSRYIHFEGNVSEEKLQKLYHGARALLCPQEEDFGLVSIEAQMNGTPVLTYEGSGIAETVLDGMTGILFTHQTDASIITAIRISERKRWQYARIKKHAHKFNSTYFRTQFQKEVMRVWRTAKR